MELKKAAMFGLDARIALAIFGALSVISGAALYSAIQESKDISLITESREFTKAIESYMLDTGVDLPIDPADAGDKDLFLFSKELVTSSATGWNGPYLSMEEVSDRYLDSSAGAYYSMRATDANFGGSTPTQPTKCGSPCFYWIGFRTVSAEQAASLDIKINGAKTDYESGNARFFPSSDRYNFWLKGPPALQQ